jgi:F-type H+-transporting ATPase subunit c
MHFWVQQRRKMKNLAKQLFIALSATLMASAAFAEEAAGAATAGHSSGGLIGLGAGLAIGVAALGGALGQGKTAAAALEGIARNPAAQGKIFTPMIIGLALIESLVIYAFVIAFFLNGKI